MKQSNKLFLFAPSLGWKYCGGATIICADSLEEAIQIGNEEERTKHVISTGGKFTNDGNGCDIWRFVEEFLLQELRDVGVVFSDANYA